MSGLERQLLRSDHGRGPGFESRQEMADNMYVTEGRLRNRGS